MQEEGSAFQADTPAASLRFRGRDVAVRLRTSLAFRIALARRVVV